MQKRKGKSVSTCVFGVHFRNQVDYGELMMNGLGSRYSLGKHVGKST